MLISKRDAELLKLIAEQRADRAIDRKRAVKTSPKFRQKRREERRF